MKLRFNLSASQLESDLAELRAYEMLSLGQFVRLQRLAKILKVVL